MSGIPVPPTSGNGAEREGLLDTIKRLRSERPELSLKDAVAIVRGEQTLGEIPARATAPAPQKALQRKYYRVFCQAASLVSRPPAGAGKRLRSRVEQAAEAFAELRAVVAQLKA